MTRIWGVALAGLFVAGAAYGAATDRIPGEQGDVEITTFIHSSLQIEHRGTVIQVDPWSIDISRAKPADLILVTDDPGHHLDPAAIKQLRKPGAPVVIPATGKARVPDGTVMNNGDSKTLAGVKVEAIPSYDLTPGEPYHPKGEANGYIVTIGGKRIFIVGVTECVPEIKAVRNIDVAFMPMNLPVGRMAVPAAVECVKALKPKIVYPYHYDQDYAANIARGVAVSSTGPGLKEFANGLRGEPVQVKFGDWYPTLPARQRAGVEGQK